MPKMCLNCKCISRFRPRYKRLIDDIFPPSPEDGLVRTNMEKLTFYTVSSPEKLDRIGEYLYQKASRDITRRRRMGYVIIAMEAMDQLLAACHSQTLNLFAESFLKIVQKLLESPEPDFQILATNSFVRFSNIEEDTPSYHRRYDFFISKFSVMCHSNHSDLQKRNKLRLAGIRGIQGVIRKTVTDDLVENIWESHHMDKIVPSLLYNMQESNHYKKTEIEQDEQEETEKMMNVNEDVPALAETCLRELMGRASFGHVKNVIRPVLSHLDLHCLWDPNVFAAHCFRLVMYSVQSQYSYVIIECIMNHLNTHGKSTSMIRAKIADVLTKIIAIAASESIGPTVLEIINSILTRLRESVSRLPNTYDNHDEKVYQEALIRALGEFAANLPDYQKIEIMMFIISKVPNKRFHDSPTNEDVHIQTIYMKCLLMVSSKYNSIQMNSTFPTSFLEPLLKILKCSDPEIRTMVNKILHTLLDRHGNVYKIQKPTITPENLDLLIEKPSRTDTIFIKKHGPDIYLSLCESLEFENNCIDNYESIYTTLALISLELITDETIVDYIRTIMNIQDICLTSTLISDTQKYNLHAIVVSLFSLIPIISPIVNIKEYINKIINNRKVNLAYHLLPELRLHYEIKSTISLDAATAMTGANQLYFNQSDLSEFLKNNDLDLLSNTSAHSINFQHRHSWVDNTSNISLKSSNSDLNAELEESGSSTPNNKFNEKLYQQLTFESMKKILTQNTDKELELEKQKNLIEKLKKSDFDEIVSNNTLAYEQSLQYKLTEMFNTMENNTAKNGNNNNSGNHKPKYETLFPDLFLY